MTDAELLELLGDNPALLFDQDWRIDNLYEIMTKDDGVQPFKPNYAQRKFYNEKTYRNTALKSRQVGLTTFCAIYSLDCALFYPGTRVGIIAHTMDDVAEIFRSKTKFAYDRLPEIVKTIAGGEAGPPSGNFKKNETELILNNGSSIRAGITMRSGTVDILHVSEMGKIAARYPDKALEIIAGTLPTVPNDGEIFFESTAEGSAGQFYDLVEKARSNNNIAKAENRKLDNLEFKFHFVAWHEVPEYRRNPQFVTITKAHQDYFEEIKQKWGVEVDDLQKAWYVLTEETLKGRKMKQEYPSHPDEAFENSDDGTFYGALMKEAEVEGRITDVLWNPNQKVETWWDIGWSDDMVVIFVQRTDSGTINIIDYHEANRTTIAEMARILSQKKYNYSRHIVPWDGKDHTDPFGDGRTRTEVAENLGLKPWVSVGMKFDVHQQIDHARSMIPRCRFDKTKAARLIECLKKHSMKWDKTNAVWTGDRRHDEWSHAADAFRTGAVAPKLTERGLEWDEKEQKLPNWGAH